MVSEMLVSLNTVSQPDVTNSIFISRRRILKKEPHLSCLRHNYLFISYKATTNYKIKFVSRVQMENVRVVTILKFGL